jgi:hypothetical protein
MKKNVSRQDEAGPMNDGNLVILEGGQKRGLRSVQPSYFGAIAHSSGRALVSRGFEVGL